MHGKICERIVVKNFTVEVLVSDYFFQLYNTEPRGQSQWVRARGHSQGGRAEGAEPRGQSRGDRAKDAEPWRHINKIFTREYLMKMCLYSPKTQHITSPGPTLTKGELCALLQMNAEEEPTLVHSFYRFIPYLREMPESLANTRHEPVRKTVNHPSRLHYASTS